MPATFDPQLTKVRDRLRFLIGDTDLAAPLLDDVTYDAALALYPDWRSAGADLAAGLASRYAQEPDSIAISGEITLSWRNRVQRWTQLAATWTALVAADGSGLQSIGPSRDVPEDPEYVRGCWPPERYA